MLKKVLEQLEINFDKLSDKPSRDEIRGAIEARLHSWLPGWKRLFFHAPPAENPQHAGTKRRPFPAWMNSAESALSHPTASRRLRMWKLSGWARNFVVRASCLRRLEVRTAIVEFYACSRRSSPERKRRIDFRPNQIRRINLKFDAQRQNKRVRQTRQRFNFHRIFFSHEQRIRLFFARPFDQRCRSPALNW